jgi:hypothetical protein
MAEPRLWLVGEVLNIRPAQWVAPKEFWVGQAPINVKQVCRL